MGLRLLESTYLSLALIVNIVDILDVLKSAEKVVMVFETCLWRWVDRKDVSGSKISAGLAKSVNPGHGKFILTIQRDLNTPQKSCGIIRHIRRYLVRPSDSLLLFFVSIVSPMRRTRSLAVPLRHENVTPRREHIFIPGGHSIVQPSSLRLGQPKRDGLARQHHKKPQKLL